MNELATTVALVPRRIEEGSTIPFPVQRMRSVSWVTKTDFFGYVLAFVQSLAHRPTVVFCSRADWNFLQIGDAPLHIRDASLGDSPLVVIPSEQVNAGFLRPGDNFGSPLPARAIKIKVVDLTKEMNGG